MSKPSAPSAAGFAPSTEADLGWITDQLEHMTTHYGMVPYDRKLIGRVVEMLKASAPSSAVRHTTLWCDQDTDAPPDPTREELKAWRAAWWDGPFQESKNRMCDALLERFDAPLPTPASS